MSVYFDPRKLVEKLLAEKLKKIFDRDIKIQYRPTPNGGEVRVIDDNEDTQIIAQKILDGIVLEIYQGGVNENSY